MAIPLLIAAIAPTPSLAAELKAKLVQPAKTSPSTAKNQQVKGLRWLSSEFPIVPLPFGFGTRLVVVLQGELRGGPERVIIWQEQGVVPDAKTGQFSISVPLTGAVTPVLFRTVDIFGNLETQHFALQVANLSAVTKELLGLGQRPWQFNAGLGVSSVTYLQSRMETFSELALTLKGSVQYWLVPRKWDLMMGGYVTALPLTSNWAGVNARFLGLNVRAGYTIPQVRRPWRLRLNAGGYYATTVVTNGRFGYSGAAGPQIYPQLQFELPGGAILSGYAKYSPVSGEGQLFDFASHELAAGLAWITSLSEGRSVAVTADFSDLSLILGSSAARSQSITFGLSFGW